MYIYFFPFIQVIYFFLVENVDSNRKRKKNRNRYGPKISTVNIVYILPTLRKPRIYIKLLVKCVYNIYGS